MIGGTINVFVINARRRLDLRLQAGDGNMTFNGAVNGTVPAEAALDIGVPELGNCTDHLTLSYLKLDPPSLLQSPDLEVGWHSVPGSSKIG